MVKKLYKHEFKAWLRVLPFFWLAMLGIAAAGRIVQIFENDSIYYQLIFGSSMVICGLTAVVQLLTPTVFGVYRFYRNLFTGEGYLSFTLPVTVGQHLWVKVSTAVCFSIFSFVVVLLSGMLLMSGEVLTEVFKAAGYLWKKIAENIPGKWVPHVIGYLLELVVILIAGLFGGHLLYESCICIGQRFRKNRVLAAVGVYFGYQLISQILSTGLGLVFTVLGVTGVMDKFADFAVAHPFGTIHLVLCGIGLVSLLLAALFWFICYGTVRKRLNLE